jgi:DNA gyrase subunit B
MKRDYGAEIDALQSEIKGITELLKSYMAANTRPKAAGEKAEIINNMHPDQRLSDMMTELCGQINADGSSGRVTYLGTFVSGAENECRQSNWIRNAVNTDQLLDQISSGSAEKVLNCINSPERLNLLLSILRKPGTVAALTESLGANSSGQIYHHLRPLIAANLIQEDEKQRGLYVFVPHRVQGIIMLLAGISDMLDPKYTEGNWEDGRSE